MTLKEADIEQNLIDKLAELKYTVRPDIRDKAALEANFRAKFGALNQVQLTNAEFARLRDEIISADVFQAAKTLREYGYFQREDGTPLHYTLVNLEDWCKKHFEVIHQLRINTDSSHHRYDVILLINGLPLVQIELKNLGINPRRAMEQIVEYRNDPGNGYIWHTTGSGKTQTSFKASTLLKDNPDIEKCLFVVDRKDLDRQTRLEFNKFQEGCVEENTKTDTLVRRLLSEDYAGKVIVTTIQKLGLALDETSKKAQQHKEKGRLTYKERLAPLRDKRLVIIFDECHRSQFGDNHRAIKAFFPKAQLFGFTGTPIFEANASDEKIDGTVGSYRTTRDIFEKQLHAYTITHAIDDRNVLRFHIDYFKPEGKPAASPPAAERTDAAAAKPARAVASAQPSPQLSPQPSPSPKPNQAHTQQAVVEAILAKHDAATNQRRFNNTLEAGKGHGGIEEIKGDYQVFSATKTQAELAALADKHGLAREALQGFVDGVLDRLIFDGEQLSESFAPLELGWKARGGAELALMAELVPLLKKQAGGREISGLAAYEH